MENNHPSSPEQLYLDALQQLQSAIELLDRANAPGHIACHVDLARHQLEEFIQNEHSRANLAQIEWKAAPQ